MAGSDERGLDLRLPWGRRPSAPPDLTADPAPPPPAAERPRRPEPARPEPSLAGEPPTDGVRPAEPGPVDHQYDDRVDVPPTRPRPEPALLAGPSAEELGSLIDESLQRLSARMADRFELVEERAAAREAGLEARLEKLESRLALSHDASVEAVGLLAGHLLAGIEEQVTRVEVAIQSRNEQLVGHVALVLARHHEELVARVEEAVMAGAELGWPAAEQRPAPIDPVGPDEVVDVTDDAFAPDAEPEDQNRSPSAADDEGSPDTAT